MRYIPYIMTAFSVAGTIANSFQKKWCFWLWICTNIFWCGYNVLNNQYAQSLLYAFNFVMCIVGLCQWRQNDIKNTLEKHRNRIQCYAPPGYIQKCYGKKYITDCIKCKYHKINDEQEVNIKQTYDRIRRCDDCRYKIFSAIPELPLSEPQAEKQTERQEAANEPEDPYTRMSNAVSEFTSALVEMVQPTLKAFESAITEFAKKYCGGDYEFLNWQSEHGDPKILHRAYNAPKYRTRKKNLSRLKREYRKYIKKGSGGQ